MFVPNFKILSQVVSEKSLTEKKFTDRQTDRQTNIRTEKAKTIYPLYTSYTGGITKCYGHRSVGRLFVRSDGQRENTVCGGV